MSWVNLEKENKQTENEIGRDEKTTVHSGYTAELG